MKKILGITLFLTACTLKPVQYLTSPSISGKDTLKASDSSNGSKDSESNRIAKLYIDSLKLEQEGKNGQACKNFMELGQINNLPIKDAAFSHVLDNCELTEGLAKNLWDKFTPPSYVKEKYYSNSVYYANSLNLKTYEAKFSYLLADYKNTQKEKVQLLQNAIKIATDLRDDVSLETYKKKLIEIAPRFETNITEKNKYLVARDFESSRDFDRARVLYYEIVLGDKSTLDEIIKAYNSIKNSYKTERKLDLFLEKSKEMDDKVYEAYTQTPDPKIFDAWVDARLALARAHWTQNDSATALRLINDLLGKSNLTDIHKGMANYLIGSIYIEQKKFSDAQVFFSKALSFKFKDLQSQENAQWSMAWSYFLNKEYAMAEKKYEAVIAKTNNPSFMARLKFWRAKALQKIGREEEALKLFSDVANIDIFSYYSLWSTSALQSELQPLPDSNGKIDTTSDNVLDWLIVVGEKKFAQNYLKEIESKFKTINEREMALKIYYATEWFQGGIRQAANFPLNIKQRIYTQYNFVLFPKANENLVNRLHAKYNVPKELIWAITRQESNFNEYARSPVDAFGLMQLIPEKAEELAVKHGIPYKEISDLYNPEINVELGTALLSDLIEKYQGKFIQTTAAYNASEEAIKTWERDRFNGDYLMFVESIPYEETRNYVKSVFTNFMTYKRSTSKTPFTIDPNFYKLPFN